MFRTVFFLIQGTVQIRPDPLSVGLGEAVADGLLRLPDPPPEAVPVPRHFFPVSFARRLSGERPGPHDVDLDERRKSHLFRGAAGLALLLVLWS